MIMVLVLFVVEKLGYSPIKYQHTGEIVEVESGEAEWSLDVLEQLFDFYYVAPKNLEAKGQALNEKLKEAGKPPLK